MSRLKEADFYYGTVLSLLSSYHIAPALIEKNSDRRIYAYTTDEGDFRAVIKYRTGKKVDLQENHNCWEFSIANDYAELKQFVDKEYKVLLFLVCGSKDVKDSELAILTKEDINQLLTQDHKMISISRKKYEKAFRIAMGNDRFRPLMIKNNRVEELFKKVSKEITP